MPSPGFAAGEYKDYKTLTSRSSKSKGSVMSPFNQYFLLSPTQSWNCGNGKREIKKESAQGEFLP